jgi:hypothetical protein
MGDSRVWASAERKRKVKTINKNNPRHVAKMIFFIGFEYLKVLGKKPSKRWIVGRYRWVTCPSTLGR